MSAGTWGILVDPFIEPTNMYIGVNIPDFSKKLGSVTVHNSSRNDIAFGTIEFNNITLSGTIDLEINGAPRNVRIIAYGENVWDIKGSCEVPAGSTSWSLEAEAFDTETIIGFGIRYNNDNWTGGYKDTGVTIPNVKNTPIDNIDLGSIHFNTLTLSGTVDIKMEGGAPVQGTVLARAAEGKNLGQCNNITGNEWYIEIPAFNTATEVYFESQTFYEDYLCGSFYPPETTAVLGSNIGGIDLGEYDFCKRTLSGTIDLKINGDVRNDIFLFAHSVNKDELDNYIRGYCPINPDGTWTMQIIGPLDETIYLKTRLSNDPQNGGWFDLNESRSITNIMSDIDFGTIAFNTITLSGELNLTVDGKHSNYPGIAVETGGKLLGAMNLTGSSWSMEIPAFSTGTELQFITWVCHAGYWPRRNTGVTRTVSGSNVSGINITYNMTGFDY